MSRCPSSREAPPTRWGPILSLLVIITTRTLDLFGDHDRSWRSCRLWCGYTTAQVVSSLEKMKKYQRDHEDPAHDDIDIDTEKQFTAQVVSSLERWRRRSGGGQQARRPSPRWDFRFHFVFFGSLSPRWDRIIWIPSFSLFCWKSGRQDNRFDFKVEVGPRCTLRESDEVK